MSSSGVTSRGASGTAILGTNARKLLSDLRPIRCADTEGRRTCSCGWVSTVELARTKVVWRRGYMVRPDAIKRERSLVGARCRNNVVAGEVKVTDE